MAKTHATHHGHRHASFVVKFWERIGAETAVNLLSQKNQSIGPVDIVPDLQGQYHIQLLHPVLGIQVDLRLLKIIPNDSPCLKTSVLSPEP